MNIIKKIKTFYSERNKKLKLENWYSVHWDDEKIFRNVNPPGKKSWNDSLKWADIERVCFNAADLYESDGIYIFVKHREESYAIPTEAKGGAELWQEIISRKLFDAELAINAAGAVNELFCWPVIEE
jgi:hypothetical protein